MTQNPLAPPPTFMERQWDAGQRHLVAGRYVSATQCLEAAEGIAFRRRDARSLARIYLPLLEARRQIRQNAAEGPVIIGAPREVGTPRGAGTIIFTGQDAAWACAAAQIAGRRGHVCLESLVLLSHGAETRIVAASDPIFAAGLPVRFTASATDLIQPAESGSMTVPLPPPGTYAPGTPLQALARESLLVAWEALALKWQARHAAGGSPWEQLLWHRRALEIDPACEPAAMKIIALAEQMERGN